MTPRRDFEEAQNEMNSLESTRKTLIKKLHAMCELRSGWSHGEGIPVSREAIVVAEQFVLVASALELHSDVFPNLDGGCAVAFYEGENRVEVSISSNGKQFGLRAERGIGFPFTDIIPPSDNASLQDIALQLKRLHILSLHKNHIWKLFASSISDNLIGQAGDWRAD